MCSTSEAVCVSNLLSAGRENVTVSPVYRGPVTTWWCIRPVQVRMRLSRAWERSRTSMVDRGLAHVSSSAEVRVGGGSGHRSVSGIVVT